MHIREAAPADRDWIGRKLRETWGPTRMVIRGEIELVRRVGL